MGSWCSFDNVSKGFYFGLIWPCGLNAGVFAGLKPIFQSDFSPKEIQSQHHSMMENKMWEAQAIREFSTKACSDPN